MMEQRIGRKTTQYKQQLLMVAPAIRSELTRRLQWRDSVWVLSENDAGDTYSNHNLVAFGPSGQNETMYTDAWYPTGGFGVGDSIELRLEPTPVTLNGSNMDCAYLMTNPEAALGYDGTVVSGGTNTFTWEGKVTMTGNLNIDDCNVVMRMYSPLHPMQLTVQS